MKNLMLLSVLGVGLLAAPAAHAAPVSFAVAIGVSLGYVGPAPVCPYGYYSYYPYACAPYGYYGPQWFSGGVFIGAGPWFHGFYGRPGYGRPGYYGGAGFRGGPVARGPAQVGRSAAGNGFRGGYARGGPASGGFHGSSSFHAGGVHGGRGR
jgi:hypothetical protein